MRLAGSMKYRWREIIHLYPRMGCQKAALKIQEISRILGFARNLFLCRMVYSTYGKTAENFLKVGE